MVTERRAPRRSLAPKRKRPDRLPAPAAPADIDALYGLEPVFEPGGQSTGAGLGEFVVIGCPYCGESYETPVDLTAGTATQIEDCQVCCQPIELGIKVAMDGTLTAVSAGRCD